MWLVFPRRQLKINKNHKVLLTLSNRPAVVIKFPQAWSTTVVIGKDDGSTRTIRNLKSSPKEA